MFLLSSLLTFNIKQGRQSFYNFLTDTDQHIRICVLIIEIHIKRTVNPIGKQDIFLQIIFVPGVFFPDQFFSPLLPGSPPDGFYFCPKKQY